MGWEHKLTVIAWICIFIQIRTLQAGEIPYLPEQTMHLEADIANLKQDTGWQPKTDFAVGIRALLMDDNHAKSFTKCLQ